ncbi:MAG TPA: PRC-barrel domain-containing protein [Usitatibacter sp.]|jgi:sporulation protein YlmC with PRC-barrel domain|nr:PRC-barrel domain-containing protein [Usitatibacter sp.]
MNPHSLRRTITRSACAAALIAMTTLPAFAASPQSDNRNTSDSRNTSANRNTSDSRNTSANNAPIAGAVPLGVTIEETALVTPGYRASELMHKEVYNEQNQKIGRVGDLVISPDGKLSVAVVDVGGFLGVGKHQVAIPVQQFKQLHPKIVLPGATKQALKDLPEFVPA